MKWCYDVSMRAKDPTAAPPDLLAARRLNPLSRIMNQTIILLHDGFGVSVVSCKSSQLPSHSKVIGLFCDAKQGVRTQDESKSESIVELSVECKKKRTSQ